MTNKQLRGLRDAIDAKLTGKNWQWREKGCTEWNTEPASIITDFFDTDVNDFRAAPEPVVRAWSRPSDVPGPVCWLRKQNNYMGVGMIQWVDTQGVVAIQCGDGTTGKFIDFDETEKMEYSTDRLTWHPCTTTEPAPGC